MYRLGKKIAGLVLAATVAVSTVTSAFAASSPISGNPNSESTVKATTTSTTTATITDASSTSGTLTIPTTITSGGKTYEVDVIATNTVKKKYSKVYLAMTSKTKVQARVLKNKSSRKTKQVLITGSKIKASQFNKKAFKNLKGKIVVKKSAMSKKQFKKLVKRLRKGGFKGKIKYRN